MITGISFVSVPVDDIDEALHFYCDVLGMEKRVDAQAGEGNRFVEVAPPGSPVALAPCTYYSQEPRATIGENSRIVFRVDDVRRCHEELTSKGVQLEGEPFDSPEGTFAAMRDPWGNFFVLSQGQPDGGS